MRDLLKLVCTVTVLGFGCTDDERRCVRYELQNGKQVVCSHIRWNHESIDLRQCLDGKQYYNITNVTVLGAVSCQP